MPIINTERIQFKNTCDCIVDYDLLSRAVYHKFPHLKNKKVKKRSIGPYGSRRQPAISVTVEKGVKRNFAVDRILAEYLWPKLTENGMLVHHKDKNVLNNKIDNLVLLKPGDHLAIHRQEAKAAGKRIGGVRTKLIDNEEKAEACRLYEKEGWTAKNLARKYKCCPQTMAARLREWGAPKYQRKPKFYKQLNIWEETCEAIDRLCVKDDISRCELVKRLVNQAENESK
jgi:transposase-like protein